MSAIAAARYPGAYGAGEYAQGTCGFGSERHPRKMVHQGSIAGLPS